MSCNNSINYKTILLTLILIVLIYIILYKAKESRKENLENLNDALRNLETNVSKLYNYDVESWSIQSTGKSAGGLGQNKNIIIISNYNTNTFTLFDTQQKLINIYVLEQNTVYTILSKNNNIIFDKVLENDMYSSTMYIKDINNNILLTIKRYPEIDGIKLKNDLTNSNLFLINSDNISTNLLSPPVKASAVYVHKSPFEEIFIDNKLTIEPKLFEIHKKCLNNKADTIQTSLTEFALYTKDFQEKNGDMTPDKFILNENTRDKIRNIIKNFKNITDKEFDCLYVNKDVPEINICKVMDRFSYEKISEILNKLILAEKFIILYHNEIIDIKTIVLPKLIHFVTICDKIKKEDKINILNLFKKIINIVNYVAYIIGGNNNLIEQINSSLKSIS